MAAKTNIGRSIRRRRIECEVSIPTEQGFFDNDSPNAATGDFLSVGVVGLCPNYAIDFCEIFHRYT